MSTCRTDDVSVGEFEVLLEFSTSEKPVLLPRPWGPWATIGWTLLCIVVMFAAQIFGLIELISPGQTSGAHGHGRYLPVLMATGTPARPCGSRSCG